MISRVIEAKSDDLRAFIEEAAGISRYKERRKETQSRVADTRENLERLPGCARRNRKADQAPAAGKLRRHVATRRSRSRSGVLDCRTARH